MFHLVVHRRAEKMIKFWMCISLILIIVTDASGTVLTVNTTGIWGHEHGLDINGHCSFIITVDACARFTVELMDDITTPSATYDMIFPGAKVYIMKECTDCPNSGLSVSDDMAVCVPGDEYRWFSWHNGTLKAGRGQTLFSETVATLDDPQFSGIKYVSLAARFEDVIFAFEALNSREGDPDPECIPAPPPPTTSAFLTTSPAQTSPTTVPASPTSSTGGVIIGNKVTGTSTTSTSTTSAQESATASITSPGTISTTSGGPAAGTTTTTTTTTTRGSNNLYTEGQNDITAPSVESGATMTARPEATESTQNQEVSETPAIVNCVMENRPTSENLGIVFDRAAVNMALAANNPGYQEIASATTASCASKCASIQPCVLYSISTTGVCRISSSCRPEVEMVPGSDILFLIQWN